MVDGRSSLDTSFSRYLGEGADRATAGVVLNSELGVVFRLRGCRASRPLPLPLCAGGILDGEGEVCSCTVRRSGRVDTMARVDSERNLNKV